MLPGLVLLSNADTDAPALSAVATVSKDGPDDGGWSLGAAAAKNGALWIDRPYYVGNPAPSWLVAKGQATHAAGGLVQVLNEPNNPIEGWQGGPSAYVAFWQAVSAADPSVLWLPAPLSPSIDGWQAWVIPGLPRYSLHCYGTLAQMQATVEWYLANTSGDCYITEVNFGAGQTVDVPTWCQTDFAPFLAWCQGQPRVKAVCWFAWRWRSPDIPLPTPVDAASWPQVVSTLQEFQPMDPTLASLQSQVKALQSQVQMLLNQNTILTNMWSLFRQGKFTGASGIDGEIVAMQGGKPLSFNPTYPPLP